MKNFEAYETNIKAIGLEALAVSKRTGLINCCDILECDNCAFSDKKCCDGNRVNWLYDEYQKPKIKIPLATKIILENLDEKWKWIAKDKDGLFIFSAKPTKGERIWKITGFGNVKFKEISNIFKCNLFDFLSWEDEEPTNIKELLGNCEVID